VCGEDGEVTLFLSFDDDDKFCIDLHGDHDPSFALDDLVNNTLLYNQVLEMCFTNYENLRFEYDTPDEGMCLVTADH